MKILLTGGTGFVGAAVLRRLVDDGHAVTAVVRSESSGETVAAAGATPLQGDLFDSAWLAAQLREHDAGVHTAAPGDETSATMDDAVVDAAVEAFGGTDKPFVHTGGVWTYGSGADLDEETPYDAPAITARIANPTVSRMRLVKKPDRALFMKDGPRTSPAARSRAARALIRPRSSCGMRAAGVPGRGL